VINNAASDGTIELMTERSGEPRVVTAQLP
jgi:hypothetical protein